MKRSIYIIFLALLAIQCQKEKNIAIFQTGAFQIGLNSKGFINQLTDIRTNKNYLARNVPASLISVRIDSVFYYPHSAKYSDSQITFYFENGLEAEVKTEEKNSHVSFELTGFNIPNKVELIAWGPIPSTIKKIIGETVGVVRNNDFAIGIQTLNPKTLGGFPWTDNDCMPQFDIFEQEDFSDLSEENKREVLYRVEAAKPEIFGSTLQAYCRNRNNERIINNLNHEKYISPPLNDGGIIGSKIALFGCPVEKTLETIGEIEVTEGLPHPTIDGEWGKKSRTASAAYLIYSFNEHNIDEAIEYTKQAGLRYLYHPGPFKNWGHFELNENEFPNGWDGLKNCVEKAKKEGIYTGVHTLSNFITTNDPYITPLPDTRLARVGSSVITENIDAYQTEIAIESPDFFNQYKNNNLHSALLGTELIRYSSVSEKAPWKLLNCERGAWGTSAASHKNHEEIHKISDHAYKVFLANPELSQEVAERLAELFNYCGLQQISFDGLEGNRSTGMGNYGEILFVQAWWNTLSDEIKKHVIIDASRTTHFFWHMYSRMNWGEPWYAGFRESQTEYRLKNQAYFSRNLMPAMLGWFSMRNNTPVEDIEWMLARSAAFNAGYAFVSGERPFKTNGQTNEILRLIGEWEKARMTNAFSNEQKERMKNINNEFTLETIAEGKWNLRQIHSFKFNHEDKLRQPGEPLFSTFTFDNPEEESELNFILTAQGASLSEIKLEINYSKKIIIPVSLDEGGSIKYTGGNSAVKLDKFLNEVENIDLNPEDLKIKNGSNSIVFDCIFSNKGKEPAAKFEVRIPGKVEEIIGCVLPGD